jgi:hypothetical protein
MRCSHVSTKSPTSRTYPFRVISSEVIPLERLIQLSFACRLRDLCSVGLHAWSLHQSQHRTFVKLERYKLLFITCENNVVHALLKKLSESAITKLSKLLPTHRLTFSCQFSVPRSRTGPLRIRPDIQRTLDKSPTFKYVTLFGRYVASCCCFLIFSVV